MGIKSITAGLSLFLLTPVPVILAQGAVNTPGSPTASGGATQQPADSVSSPAESDRVIVNDVPIEQSILPTTRPIDSVYGLDTSVMDTPRNVTIISREQLSAVDIQDPRDFSKLTSDSYTQSNFGAPANPSIRGQTADVFINGMRRGLTSNGNGFPIDFNSVESVDIIKGPANSVYGASQYVGGYVDEVTKQPYFDKFQGNIGTTIGEYQVYRWTADFGGPLIKDQLAYRISYTGEDSGSYYDNSHKQSEAVYAAITWMPTSKFTLSLNGEWNEADYNENNGINRVTQNLIDNDKYITGTVVGAPDAIQPFFNPVTTTGQVNLDHALHIIGADDGSYGHTEYAQALQTYTANENFKIINNTLYERVDRRTFNSQQFDEVLKDNAAVEDRLEFILDTDIPIGGGTMKDLHASKDAKEGKDAKAVAQNMDKDGGLTFHNQLNTGLDFRYQNNTNYDTFADEPFDAFDITHPIKTVYIPTANILAAGGQYHVPGEPSQYLFSPLNGDNAHSEFYEFGPYFQDIIKFTPQLSLLFGARADILYVQSETPPGTPASVYLTNTTTQVLPSANISPTYKPFSFLTTYFTFNFSQSTNTGDGGDYSPTFASTDYHQPSYLYEVGAKFSLLKNTLFLTGTGYIQNRENPSIGGTSVKVDVKGLEFEANYQPNKHIYATTSYSLLDAHTLDPGFTHEATPITLSDSVPPGTVLTTDVGSFVLPTGGYTGRYRTPGYPEHLFNGLVSYKTDFGLGATADIQVTSPMTVSYDGDTKIHWQYNVDFSVFYTFQRYEARVGIYNATNQHNWNPANPIYGNESIFADEPIHVEGTFKIKF